MKSTRFFPLLVAFTFVIFSCHYKTTEEIDFYSIEAEEENVHSVVKESSAIVIKNSTSTTGLLFYPGAKVDYQAYYSLLEKVSEANITCFLIHMPGDYAIFDMEAATRYIKNHPEIEHWYICGHSLGGAMASVYAGNSPDKLEGLILLAAYSTKDLTTTDLKVLSIYGSQDGVLNMKNYEKNKKNLPADFSEFIIEGGNHAGFGTYGPQKKDKPATITSEQQQALCAEKIIEFISEEN